MTTEPTASHYHAAGDVELDGFKPSKRYPNGACRCENHIAPRLKATRAVLLEAYIGYWGFDVSNDYGGPYTTRFNADEGDGAVIEQANRWAQ